MVKKKSSNSREGWQTVVVGWVAGIMTALFLMMISAWFMTVKDCSETLVSVLSYTIILFSCLVGGFVSSRTAGRQGLKVGAIIGGTVFATVLVSGVITNGFQGDVQMLIKGALSVVFGVLGGIFGVNTNGKRKMK